MRLTNIQLIHAAHHAARYLPKASAELVRELATRLDVVLVTQREAAKQRDALAAENAALKLYICDECYVENVRTGHYACAGHGMPSTPATDAYMAKVRATAITDALEKSSDYLDTDCVMDRLDISYEDAQLRSSGAIELHDALVAIANQLRKEAVQ